MLSVIADVFKDHTYVIAPDFLNIYNYIVFDLKVMFLFQFCHYQTCFSIQPTKKVHQAAGTADLLPVQLHIIVQPYVINICHLAAIKANIASPEKADVV